MVGGVASLGAALSCVLTLRQIRFLLRMDQAVFGSKRAKAIDTARVTEEWGRSIAAFETVVDSIRVGKEPQVPPETHELVLKAVEACTRREAELACMSPEEREKALEKWAHDLLDSFWGKEA
jgi:hypothetical protein